MKGMKILISFFILLFITTNFFFGSEMVPLLLIGYSIILVLYLKRKPRIH
jgi:4-hydroxybenzoate polyprenyltransferase